VGHREQLLAAARRLLESKGYAHITTRDLVAESGTNLASIGYHFGSKAGLLSAAIGIVLAEWTDQLAVTAMADPGLAPLDRGRVTWTTMLEGLPAKRALLLSYMEALAQADRSPELRTQFATHYRTVRGRVAQLVSESFGDIAADDPRSLAMASFVIAVCDGLSLQFLLDPDSLPTPAELDVALATAVNASVDAAVSGGSETREAARRDALLHRPPD
jgi:AcrR family transcriptional regulator